MVGRRSIQLASRIAKQRAYPLHQQQVSGTGSPAVVNVSTRAAATFGERRDARSLASGAELRVRASRELGPLVRPVNATFSTSASEADIKAFEGKAADYYDDANTLNFYKQVWGDTMHTGRYGLLQGEDANLEGKARIVRATELAGEVLLQKVFCPGGPSPDTCTIMDMGGASGELARMAASTYGCKVVCIDLSRELNVLNAERSAAAGLSDKIIIPGERSYFDTQVPDSSMDAVVSQDAFGHAYTEQHRAIKEAARVLKPGGMIAFTDLMKSDTADLSDLEEVFRHRRIKGIASPALYRGWAEDYGMEFVEFDDKTTDFAEHYSSILAQIASIRGTIEGVSDEHLDWMTTRYGAWVTAANNKVVTTGEVVMKKK